MGTNEGFCCAYHSGAQGMKVRILLYAALALFLGAIAAAFAIRADLGPTGEGLALGYAVILLGAATFGGMLIFADHYVSALSLDAENRLVEIDTPGFFGDRSARYSYSEFGPISRDQGSAILRGYRDTPSARLPLKGRRLPFILDLQGMFVREDLYKQFVRSTGKRSATKDKPARAFWRRRLGSAGGYSIGILVVAAAIYGATQTEHTAGNDRSSVTEIRRLAADGDAGAQYELALMYDDSNGDAVPMDDAEAIAWYRRAAEQGHAGAQNNLGVMHETGEGTIADTVAAVAWYRQAAAQGHAIAQNNMGVIYDTGTGVAEDDAEAVRWYEMAAAQGYADAEARLAELRQ